MYFPQRLSFSPLVSFFDPNFLFLLKELLLSWKELLIISIINAPLNIDGLASFSSCKILIGLFEFNRKLVEIF